MRSNRVKQLGLNKKTASSPFGTYARIYDVLAADKQSDEECRFVDALLHDFAPRAQQLLELGCGTGHTTIALANLGYTVCGVDASKPMLDRAAANIATAPREDRSRIELLHDDVRTVRLQRKFDAVISLSNVIGYQISNDDIRLSLKTIREHLHPQGTFIFDCWYGPAVLHKLPQRRVKCAQTDQLAVTRTAEPELCANQNVVDIKYNIIVRNKSSAIEETINETHRIRYFFIPEMQEFCSSVGLELISAQEWLSDKEPSLTTWNIYFAGRVNAVKTD